MMTNLAHESRNAIQRSQACLERLKWRLQEQPESLDLVERAMAAHNDLARLFGEVRTYAAPMTLDWEPCQLSEVWREAWRQVCAVYPDHEPVLREDVVNVSLWISADMFRLIQVFRNLFENAFAASGDEINVDIACRETNIDGKLALGVTLRDHGSGFPQAKLGRVFEPFFTTKPKGSGLGLPICKRIVEAHGGTMNVRNHPEGGAEIIITLPRR